MTKEVGSNDTDDTADTDDTNNTDMLVFIDKKTMKMIEFRLHFWNIKSYIRCPGHHHCSECDNYFNNCSMTRFGFTLLQ